ncbi:MULTISPECIES: DUF418 domain-containing protein [Lysobacter]|uniref:DUF418 domain-containing protein n=1 Tax=Lysobacter TaxID=68 RepID=UPI001F2D1D20|nr:MULTISPECIES: DUF418 domain-containing protein [Lysobacter]UJB17756.1 DUF418 domain-containing protein [Lysobacter capsici]UJQ28522.1 DUF418 domain-containing protein [Lysobacter gummosus]
MIAAPPEFAPIPARERLLALDALRGIALLGILLSNVASFAGPLAELSEGIDPKLSGSDYWLSAFVYVAIRNKFWTLFSLLFGMGFAVMLERARDAGRGFGAVYLRRSIGLLAIGLIHAWLIWAGDILVTYALSAFVLLALRSWSGASWLKLGAALYLGTIAYLLLVAAALTVPGVAQGDAADLARAQAERAAEVAVYARGAYFTVTEQRLRFFFESTTRGWIMMLPLSLGLFLIGAGLARTGLVADPLRHRALLRGFVRIGLPVGAMLTAASLMIDSAPSLALFSASSMLAQTLHMLAGLPLALALIAGVLLLMQGGARWPLRFAPAGRMALSNYLGQSLIATWALYHHGLNLWGRLSYTELIAAAVVLFALQMAASVWWLKHFRFGPLEWLWRAFAYWRWPAMRSAFTRGVSSEE